MTRRLLLPTLAGATGMVFVGGSVAVSGALAGAPVLTVQALRYGVACLLLMLFARRVSRPRGAEWLWLLGLVLTGIFVFNLALVYGARHAEPAVLGVAVACVPVLFAVAGPVLEGQRPAARLVLSAVVVTGGAALVQGFGRADGVGFGCALVTFACEACFTLLAVPVLRAHGPMGVSVHATWMAAVLFGVAGVAWEGPGAVLRLRLDDLLAGAYLAVAVTAVAFVLWYTCVTHLGSARAGLLTGIAPLAAAATGVTLGGPLPGLVVWAGVLIVAVGLALGLRPPALEPAAPPVPASAPAPPVPAPDPAPPVPASAPAPPVPSSAASAPAVPSAVASSASAPPGSAMPEIS